MAASVSSMFSILYVYSGIRHLYLGMFDELLLPF